VPPFPGPSPDRQRSRGSCAASACRLEASAPKPGNVHPGASFPDLDHGELIAAGLAIAPVLDGAPDRPLGTTILECVRASRRVTRSNANLGIVLALTPLAATPGPPGAIDPNAVAATLARLTPADAAAVWEAIRVAAPGGMGRRGRHDLAGPPPDDLLAAMRAAAGHDQIARLWTEGYGPLQDGLVADLAESFADALPADAAIVRAFLRQLAREPDSLIVRRHGAEVAADVSAAAVVTLAATDWQAAARRLDARLRDPVRINPGTTADLVAAALYILLWEGRIDA
jgi:triphosphoribosyl-dephospho-CoA synthase